MTTLTIDPVTRIEGHARITIQLDDRGEVSDARLHITQFRGFEKLCEGRPFFEMPSLMARICGICPVSHLIASAKACDALLAVRIPETAANLRRVMNLAQIVQSHALSYFYLSSPDLVLGLDADPAARNLAGVLKEDPETAADGIRLRRFGQTIIELLGGKRIHPAWVVPGGVSEPLTEEKRDRILEKIPEAMRVALRALDRFKSTFSRFEEEIRTFGNFPTMFMGLVEKNDEGRARLSFYDGALRFADDMGNVVEDDVEPARYARVLGEAVEPDSFLKSPYYLPRGYPDGIYRVGPLARLDIVDGCGTARADQEWAEFRALRRGAVLSSFHYHYARLVEILFGVERIEQLLTSPDILSRHVRAHAEPNAFEGVGVSEAPRGTLLHHYRIDERGMMEWANLVIATGHNNLAMNRGILQVARHYVRGEKLEEGMLNRVEALVRCYDPCLSCSTHALGEMPMRVTLHGSDGTVLDERAR
jgi:NAD-reducing hydrogenase large subunit